MLFPNSMVGIYYLLCAIFSFSMCIEAVYPKCFTCTYDDKVSGTKNYDEDCKSSSVDQTNVGVTTAVACQLSLYYWHGNLVSVYRGSNNSTQEFKKFASSVNRDPQAYFTTVCDTDLCNGAPSLRICGGMMAAFVAFITLRSTIESLL